MKNVFVFLSLLYLVLILFPCFLISQVLDWPTYQQNPQRTGSTPFPGNFQDTAYILWERHFDDFLWAPSVAGDVNNDGKIDIAFILGGLRIISGENGQLIWAKTLPNNGDMYSYPVIGDVNLDGLNEIVVGFSSLEGTFHHVQVLRGSDGFLLWEFNENEDSIRYHTPEIGDVDGDSIPEVIFTKLSGIGSSFFPTAYILNGEDGSVYMRIDSLSFMLFAAYYGQGIGPPVLGDLDNDGVLDIIGIFRHPSFYSLYAFNVKDTQMLWEISIGYLNKLITVSIADLDGNGKNEVVYSYRAGPGLDTLWVKCVTGDSGNFLWEYYVVTDSVSGMYISQPAIGDVNGDGNKEVIVIDTHSKILALNFDGSLLWLRSDFNFDDAYLNTPYLGPAIADLDNDSISDILVISNHYSWDYSAIICLNGTNGNTKWYLDSIGSRFVSQRFTVADFDNDGFVEILITDLINPLGFDGFDLKVLNEEPVGIKEKKRTIKIIYDERYYLYNILGQKIRERDIKRLPQGIYFKRSSRKIKKILKLK